MQGFVNHKLKPYVSTVPPTILEAPSRCNTLAAVNRLAYSFGTLVSDGVPLSRTRPRRIGQAEAGFNRRQ